MESIYYFEHLKKNIYDYIYEGMIKLGYDKNKSVSIFYQKGLLCWLLKIDEGFFDNNFNKIVNDFKNYIYNYLGDVKFENIDDRYKITISFEGIINIANEYKNHTFLKRLIDVIKNKNCTINDIEKVFSSVSDNYIKKEFDNFEFQYVFYFKDKSIDEFKYCFSFDSIGKYYHRLIDYDYEKVISDYNK